MSTRLNKPHLTPEVRLIGVVDPQPPEILALSFSDAIRVSGMGKTALYDAINRGDLQAVKAGSRTLILMDSLRAYMDRLPRCRPIRARETP